MASKRKHNGKRTIRINGRELSERDSRTLAESIWSERMARIDRDKRLEALEEKEALA